MPHDPILTSVIGSYPFPGWLEYAAEHLDEFGPADIAEMQADATTAAIMDQVRAGIDVITDGEQSRFDSTFPSTGSLMGSSPTAHRRGAMDLPPTTSGASTRSSAN